MKKTIISFFTCCTAVLIPVLPMAMHKKNNINSFKEPWAFEFEVTDPQFVGSGWPYNPFTQFLRSPRIRAFNQAHYFIWLTPLGAKLMWLFTTHGPVKHHPATNFMWWLNTYGPGFNTHLEQPGDYLMSIASGRVIGTHVPIHNDGSIISDFERIIGGSLWSKIETYLTSKSTSNLEIDFQYNYNSLCKDGFYVNASWKH